MASFAAQFAQAWSTPRPAFTPNLFKFTELHPQVQKHLARVYLTLFASLLVCSLGTVAGLYWPVLLPIVGLVSFGSLLGLAFIPQTPYNQNKRYGLLATFSFATGYSLTPLVALASATFPSLVVTALLATSLVFMCFSASALLTPRRSYMFLGGYLSSAITLLFAMRWASWLFGQSVMAFQAELLLGLLAFSGYVLYDTQLIVERAYAGEMDHVKHAQELFIDFVAVFVRVLVLLLKNAEKRKEREEQERRKRR